jgi:hypothetical protein
MATGKRVVSRAGSFCGWSSRSAGRQKAPYACLGAQRSVLGNGRATHQHIMLFHRVGYPRSGSQILGLKTIIVSDRMQAE